MAKSPRPFNEAFAKLRERAAAERSAARLRPPPRPPPRRRLRRPGRRPRRSSGRPPPPARARWRIEHGTIAPPPPRGAPGAFWHPDLDAVDELRALVRGDAPFDLADGDEFVEGRVAGLDPNLVRKLRRGDFAVQGHVDLHGMTRDEAKREVEAFLRASRSAGKRCVVVVHGRGLHSKDQLPVLKEALRTWLSTARFARHVLAFATARPVDGGAGAVYVLLRRAGR